MPQNTERLGHYPTLNAWNWCSDTYPTRISSPLYSKCAAMAVMISPLLPKRWRQLSQSCMWRALLAGVVFQHVSIESLLRELRRNPALLTLCEFDPIPLQSPPKKIFERVDDVLRVNFISQPLRSTIYKTARAVARFTDSHNFSRFLKLVVKMEQKQGLIAAIIPTLREQLMAVLPDFGQHLGYDGKAIDSHATGNKNKKTGKTSDPDADWGKHETKGVSKDGKPWQKIKTWFGYSLHLQDCAAVAASDRRC